MSVKKSSQYIIQRKLNYFNCKEQCDYIWSYDLNNPQYYPNFAPQIEEAQIFLKSDAEQLVKELNEAVYYLGNNEYARPEYTIIPV